MMSRFGCFSSLRNWVVVIVNKTHLGLVYKDQIFQDINVGDHLKGVVKKIRPGNKLDIALGQFGYRSLEPNAELLLNTIEDHGGFGINR